MMFTHEKAAKEAINENGAAIVSHQQAVTIIAKVETEKANVTNVRMKLMIMMMM